MAVLRLLILLIVPMVANSKEDTTEVRRWCFYTNWAQYRSEPAKFFPEDINATLCTHISYAYAKFNKNNELASYEWNDEDLPWAYGMYSRVNQLKSQNPNLKTLLAIGGWFMGSSPFYSVVSNEYNRNKFINKAVTFLRTNGFDGLDICWMYPSEDSSIDKENFGYLLQGLKHAFTKEAMQSGKEKLLLGIVVASEKAVIDGGYDIDSINKYVDVISILSYDFYIPLGIRRVMHPSALYPGNFTTGKDSEKNVKFTAEYWNNLGIPKEKINIGIPFYGRSYRSMSFTSNNTMTQEGISFSYPGNKGIYTNTVSFLAYNEICNLNRSKSVFMEDRGVPYIISGDEWIGYENVRSVQLKADFALQNNYGGLMFWALDLDDFNGVCPGKEKYPLLNAVNRVVKGDYNSTETFGKYGKQLRTCLCRIRPHQQSRDFTVLTEVVMAESPKRMFSK